MRMKRGNEAPDLWPPLIHPSLRGCAVSGVICISFIIPEASAAEQWLCVSYIGKAPTIRRRNKAYISQRNKSIYALASYIHFRTIADTTNVQEMVSMNIVARGHGNEDYILSLEIVYSDVWYVIFSVALCTRVRWLGWRVWISRVNKVLLPNLILAVVRHSDDGCRSIYARFMRMAAFRATQTLKWCGGDNWVWRRVRGLRFPGVDDVDKCPSIRTMLAMDQNV